MYIHLNRSQLFPAVTLCSGNPVRYDKYLRPLISFLRSRNAELAQRNITRDDIYYGGFNFMVDLFNQNRTSEMLSYGFQLEDMLMSCSYNGYDCRGMWTRTLSPFLGNCYTFNRRTIDGQSKLFQINDVDPKLQAIHIGLAITFYLNVELYFPVLEYGQGLSGILHNPDEPPLIRYAGQRFSPGFEHSLVYQKSISTYLGSPYTSCTEQVREDMRSLYNLFDKNTDYTYSETVCLELCQQVYIHEQCGCVYPIYFYLNQVSLSMGAHLTRCLLCYFSC